MFWGGPGAFKASSSQGNTSQSRCTGRAYAHRPSSTAVCQSTQLLQEAPEQAVLPPSRPKLLQPRQQGNIVTTSPNSTGLQHGKSGVSLSPKPVAAGATATATSTALLSKDSGLRRSQTRTVDVSEGTVLAGGVSTLPAETVASPSSSDHGGAAAAANGQRHLGRVSEPPETLAPAATVSGNGHHRDYTQELQVLSPETDAWGIADSSDQPRSSHLALQLVPTLPRPSPETGRSTSATSTSAQPASTSAGSLPSAGRAFTAVQHAHNLDWRSCSMLELLDLIKAAQRVRTLVKLQQRQERSMNCVHVAAMLCRMVDLIQLPSVEQTRSNGIKAPRRLELHVQVLRLVKKLCSQCLPLVASVDCRTAANICWALGRLRPVLGLELPAPIPPLVEQLLAQVFPDLTTAAASLRLQPADCMQLLYGLSRLQLRPPEPWMDGFFAVSLQQLPTFSLQELVGTMHGCADLEVVPPAAWVTQWLSCAQQVHPSCTSQELADMIWSLGTLKLQPGQPWLDSFIATSLPLLAQTPAVPLSCMIWGLGRLQHHPGEAWLGQFYSTSQLRMPSLFAPEMTMLMHGMGALRLAPAAAWLGNFYRASQLVMPKFTTQELADILWSITQMRQVPPRQWMTAYLYNASLRHFHHYRYSAVRQIMLALQELQVANLHLYAPHVVEQLMVSRKRFHWFLQQVSQAQVVAAEAAREIAALQTMDEEATAAKNAVPLPRPLPPILGPGGVPLLRPPAVPTSSTTLGAGGVPLLRPPAVSTSSTTLGPGGVPLLRPPAVPTSSTTLGPGGVPLLRPPAVPTSGNTAGQPTLGALATSIGTSVAAAASRPPVDQPMLDADGGRLLAPTAAPASSGSLQPPNLGAGSDKPLRSPADPTMKAIAELPAEAYPTVPAPAHTHRSHPPQPALINGMPAASPEQGDQPLSSASASGVLDVPKLYEVIRPVHRAAWPSVGSSAQADDTGPEQQASVSGRSADVDTHVSSSLTDPETGAAGMEQANASYISASNGSQTHGRDWCNGNGNGTGDRDRCNGNGKGTGDRDVLRYVERDQDHIEDVNGSRMGLGRTQEAQRGELMSVRAGMLH